MAFGVLTLAVGLASGPLDEMARQPGPSGTVALGFAAAVMVPAVAVGTLLAARRPRNPIGWLLLAIFLLAVDPAGDYAIIDYRMHHGTLPLGSVAVVLLPAGRWRRPAVILVAAGAALAVQVPRYRRASAERRQQLKWLYSGAVIFVACLFLAVLTNDSGSAWSLAVNDVISPIGFAVLPFCVGVAVLKYRLYAIDRIISRVISYAVLSAVLAGVFAGLVLLATEVLPFHTPVGVAVATLAAAALFNPLRRRVQRAVEPVHVSAWLPGTGQAR